MPPLRISHNPNRNKERKYQTKLCPNVPCDVTVGAKPIYCKTVTKRQYPEIPSLENYLCERFYHIVYATYVNSS
jgi:hypothetical protein